MNFYAAPFNIKEALEEDQNDTHISKIGIVARVNPIE